MEKWHNCISVNLYLYIYKYIYWLIIIFKNFFWKNNSIIIGDSNSFVSQEVVDKIVTYNDL